MNLVLTKAVFQLFFLQAHTLRMQSTGDMFFQIRFRNLSGALLHNELVKGHVILYLVHQVYKACSKYDFSLVNGMSSLKKVRAFYTKFYMNILSMTLLNNKKAKKVLC